MSVVGDALPILALALQRMMARRRRPDGRIALTVEEARSFIETAVEDAAQVATASAGAGSDDLRRLVVPRLATWDPAAGVDGAAKREVVSAADLFTGPRAGLKKLADALVAQRLLTCSGTRAGISGRTADAAAYEIAHEALLRVPPLGPLIYARRERFDQARILQIEAREWAAAGRVAGRLARSGDRLSEAKMLLADADFGPDLARKKPSVDPAREPMSAADYLAACEAHERNARARRRRLQASINVLMAATILGLVAWMNEAYLKEQGNYFVFAMPYMIKQVRPYVLAADVERALKPKDSFVECAGNCPAMIVLPAGEFMMGSSNEEIGHFNDESPQHLAKITRPFAVSAFDVTFADWDACVSVGGCPQASDSAMGRRAKPVVNVSWDDAQKYVVWLSRITGKAYRLLTEAEWEYAARAGTISTYYWGEEVSKENANCDGCGSQWDERLTSPVGSFKPNGFGIYDMAGNVWQWVKDCYHDHYHAAPEDGSAWLTKDCSRRVLRGGAWRINPWFNRSAVRGRDPPDFKASYIGFRVGRTLTP